MSKNCIALSTTKTKSTDIMISDIISYYFINILKVFFLGGGGGTTMACHGGGISTANSTLHLIGVVYPGN